MKMDFHRIHKALLLGLLSSFSIYSYSATPIFNITPRVFTQSSLIKGQQGTGIFQVTNFSGRNLNGIGLYALPVGVSQVVPTNGINYCSMPFNLNANSSCLIKLLLNTNLTSGNVTGGPKVCYSATRPIYCSQPLDVNQLNTQVTSGNIPQSCEANVANFDYELTQDFDSSEFVEGWGAGRNVFQLSPANPKLTDCATTSGVTWSQQRIIAAADFWIKQKLNYCHHYSPDYMTPISGRNATLKEGGYCSAAVDIMPGSAYYNQPVRWNYSGTGSETSQNWINNNYMWYGMDCSNFTAFIYDFAFGTVFDSKTNYQAGQREGTSQDNLSPNKQTTGNELDNPNAAGLLVCSDGTLEVNHSCAGHSSGQLGNYLSIVKNNAGDRVPEGVITPTLLSTILKPGDLLFIAGGGIPASEPGTSEVTHVIMWTGKQVGYGANDINPAQIAPDEICATSWTPQVGDWVIADSHYQGPDYRILTSCFYLNNLWGVRRVIY